MKNPANLYDFWVEFIAHIIGNDAPEALYVISFVLFIVLFFGVFLKVIKVLLGGK